MIRVTSRSYEDHLGRSLSFPIGNQGDKGKYKLTFEVMIGIIASNSNVIEVTTGATQSIIRANSFNWGEVGFVVGDSININLLGDPVVGVPDFIATSTINLINGDEMIVSSVAPQSAIYYNGYIVDTAGKMPQAFEVQFNLTPNDQSILESIVEGSTTTLRSNATSTLAVNASTNLTLLNNKSGSIINSATLKRLADKTDGNTGATIHVFEVTVDFFWWGYLTALGQPYFENGRCITPIERLTYFPEFNNFSNRLTTTFLPAGDGNSGFINENFNQNPAQIRHVSTIWKDNSNNIIQAFDYSAVNKFEITLNSDDGYGNNFGLIFFNDIQDLSSLIPSTINNLGNYSLSRHTIFSEYSTINTVSAVSFLSNLAIDGSGLTFSNVIASVTGNTAVITGTITPNSQFISKFSDVNNFENIFTLRARAETQTIPANNYSTTVNVECWKGETIKAPIVLGGFNEDSFAIYDHHKSPTDYIITEDDNRLVSLALFNKAINGNLPYEAVIFSNICRNSVTGESFILERYSIALDTTILNDDTQNVNHSMQVYYNIPSTAPNAEFKITRETGIDTLTEYGVGISFPFVERWEYWLPQLNANIAFNGSQNKDWHHYQQNNWQIVAQLELQTSIGNYINQYPYSINDYDANPNVSVSFEFERQDGTIVSNPVQGELIKMRAKFTSLNANNIAYDWNQLTIEPFEGLQRFMISSVYPQGLQPLNPLLPINSNTQLLEVIDNNTTQVIVECMLDLSRIDTSKGISVTARGEDTSSTSYEHSIRSKKDFKVIQLPNKPNSKGGNYICCTCEPELALADVNSDSGYRNDFKSVFHKKQLPGDSVTFKMYHNDILVPNYGIAINFPNDTLTSGFCYSWRPYLINIGAGCYTIKKEYTIAGVQFEEEIDHIVLMQYDIDTSQDTTRLMLRLDQSTMFDDNGNNILINFNGSGYETCIRVRNSFFGRSQLNPETIHHFSNNRELRKTKVQYKETFEMQINGITKCMYDKLRFNLLAGEIIRVTEHAFNSFDEKETVYWCELNTENSISNDWYDGSNLTTLNIEFRNRHANEISRFDSNTNVLNGVSYNLGSIAGGGLCAPATINIQYSDGTPITTLTIASGATTTYIVPCSPPLTNFIVDENNNPIIDENNNNLVH